MEKLKEQIKVFYSSTGALEKRMRELAKHFLFGGYINVRNQYHIYIKTVEFYYHEEDGMVKDPIMYHRNNNFIEGEIPYFKLLSFNSHDTGVDITFENEEKKIRASVLIRAYEVLRLSDNKRLVWNSQNNQFQEYKEGDKPNHNTQCMYLKRILNGFAPDGIPDIMWVDDDANLKDAKIDTNIKSMQRQGVFESKDSNRYIADRKKKNTREWAFRREKEILLH